MRRSTVLRVLPLLVFPDCTLSIDISLNRLINNAYCLSCFNCQLCKRLPQKYWHLNIHIYSPRLPNMLACLPCWPACNFCLPVMLACLPCWPTCHDFLSALLVFASSTLALLKFFFKASMPRTIYFSQISMNHSCLQELVVSVATAKIKAPHAVP